MDLGKISVEPRLRNQWQAIDLGCEMARQWYRPMLLAWLIPALALWLSLSLLFCPDHINSLQRCILLISAFKHNQISIGQFFLYNGFMQTGPPQACTE